MRHESKLCAGRTHERLFCILSSRAQEFDSMRARPDVQNARCSLLFPVNMVLVRL